MIYGTKKKKKIQMTEKRKVIKKKKSVWGTGTEGAEAGSVESGGEHPISMDPSMPTG